jgi:hypothetical protein
MGRSTDTLVSIPVGDVTLDGDLREVAAVAADWFAGHLH